MNVNIRQYTPIREQVRKSTGLASGSGPDRIAPPDASTFAAAFYVPEAPGCDVAGMAWILTLATVAFWIWLARRAHDRAAEHAATGMLRSPLYWTSIGLTVVLLGLAFAARYALAQDGALIWAWLAALGLTLIAIFLVRRALKWRYPI